MKIYWVYVFGPEIELTIIRRWLFEITFHNPWLMLIVQSLVIIAFILSIYYVPQIPIWLKRTTTPSRDLLQIANGGGLFFSQISIVDLLSDVGLLPMYLPWIFIAVWIICGVNTIIFLRYLVSNNDR